MSKRIEIVPVKRKGRIKYRALVWINGGWQLVDEYSAKRVARNAAIKFLNG